MTALHPYKMVERPDPWQTHAIDAGIIPMLNDFERNGIKIDVARAAKLGKYLDQVMEESAELTQNQTGYRFNVSSDEEFADVLFNKLGLPTEDLKKTKSGARFSIGKDELAKINHLHDSIETRQKFKEAQKLKGTYVEKMPRVADDNDRVHGGFSEGPATGRLRSHDPNLQNIPARTEMGREVKKLFIPEDGCYLVDLDYSQIELRCAAHVYNDPTMIQVYRDGDDLHWKTAEGVYQKPRAELDKKDHRLPSKTTNFLTIYEGSAPSLRTKLIATGADREYWTEERVQSMLIEGFYRTYSGVARGIEESHDIIRRYGKMCDMWGRVRRVEAVWSTHQKIQNEAMRQGGNMRIQGACAGLIKIAMPLVRALCQEIERAGAVCRPLLQVHDSLIFEVAKEAIDVFIPEAMALMAGVCEWRVPIETSGDYGLNWGEVGAWKN